MTPTIQLPDHLQASAEELIDWILTPNSLEKDSLETFGLSLTPEGKLIRKMLLSAFEPVLSREKCGESWLLSSRFPRESLMNIAKIALKDFCHERQ
jgi:hypothetical protein